MSVLLKKVKTEEKSQVVIRWSRCKEPNPDVKRAVTTMSNLKAEPPSPSGGAKICHLQPLVMPDPDLHSVLRDCLRKYNKDDCEVIIKSIQSTAQLCQHWWSLDL